MSNDSAAPATVETHAAKNDGTNARVVVKIDQVRRVFEDGTQRLEILKNASLQLRRGEVVSLVGMSGSGKSTLLHIAGLLDRPTSGEVIIDGTPAGTLGERDRAYLRNKHIGFIFQHFFLLPEFSVLENILMPAQVGVSATGWMGEKKRMTDRALELVDAVGLKDRVTKRPATLSGGERQRVAVARALLQNPQVLLCDEPTGSLDPDTALSIINLVFELSRAQGTAVFIVTHDRTISTRAHRVLRLDHGVLSPEK